MTMWFNAVLIDDGEQRTYIGSHVSMCVIDQPAQIVHNFNSLVNVVGYDTSKGIMTLNCQTVLAAVAYYCPMTWEVFIIDIRRAILIDHLHNNILCPI